MLVLGIETSCDETGIALYHSERGLLADVLHSQVELHAEYGGVVPELASRDHIRKITPLIREIFDNTGLTLKDLDAVAYTAGPGLVGALMVGAGFGRTLAWALGVPAIAVNHMEAHLLAPLIDASQSVPMPFLALLVSGGHTQLVQVCSPGNYKLLGESLDDAAGEAFDKAAKMLDLPYPGGPNLAECAESGNPGRFRFPRPMTDRPGLDFSFSGLKTYTLNTINALTAGSAGKTADAGQGARRSATAGETSADKTLTDQDRADVARAFEEAVVDTLLIKCRRAVEQTGTDHLIIAGGVSANLRLRKKLEENLSAMVVYAPQALCTDNGAMIAYAGCQRLLHGEHADLAVRVRARWPVTELAPMGDQSPA